MNILPTDNHLQGDFSILKSNDELMIGGYASIEIVDKQKQRKLIEVFAKGH
jgi:hypothetical protein